MTESTGVGRGGKREGAGRPKGSLNKKSQAMAKTLMEDGGISPLEVMVYSMRGAYEEGDFDRACGFAKDAAPYMHPRLATFDMKTDTEGNVDMNMVVKFV